jgi:hypothetical protein
MMSFPRVAACAVPLGVVIKRFGVGKVDVYRVYLLRFRGWAAFRLIIRQTELDPRESPG